MNPCPKACRSGFLRAHSGIWDSPRQTPPDGLMPTVASFYEQHLKALMCSSPTIMTPGTESVGGSGRRAALSRESEFVIVGCCFSPLLRGTGSAARLPNLQKPPSKPEHPHVDSLLIQSSRRLLNARSMSRFASRSAAASRLSCSCLPLHRPSSSFIRPSFRYSFSGTSA